MKTGDQTADGSAAEWKNDPVKDPENASLVKPSVASVEDGDMIIEKERRCPGWLKCTGLVCAIGALVCALIVVFFIGLGVGWHNSNPYEECTSPEIFGKSLR